MSDKVMNFDEFDSKDSLEDPKTAVETPEKPKGPKETFVDQVKKADLTQPKVTEPDYTETTEVDKVNEDTQDITQLRNVVTQLEQQIFQEKTEFNEKMQAKEKDLMDKKVALANMIEQEAQKPQQTDASVSQPIGTTPQTVTPVAPVIQ